MIVHYNNSVFLNCPFDEQYREMHFAIIYATYSCGFYPRSALEEDNALTNRLQKIGAIISECRFGIHDISRIEANSNGLPRFNMPFELGIFFGAKIFGNQEHQSKIALVLEKVKFSYQQYISDLNGIDTQAHNNDTNTVIKIVSDWLRTASRRTTLPIEGYLRIIEKYNVFRNDFLPEYLEEYGSQLIDLTFTDYCFFVEEYLRFSRR